MWLGWSLFLLFAFCLSHLFFVPLILLPFGVVASVWDSHWGTVACVTYWTVSSARGPAHPTACWDGRAVQTRLHVAEWFILLACLSAFLREIPSVLDLASKSLTILFNEMFLRLRCPLCLKRWYISALKIIIMIFQHLLHHEVTVLTWPSFDVIFL